MSFFNERLFASMAMADILRFPGEDLHDHAPRSWPKEAKAPELPLPVGSSRQEPHCVEDCPEADSTLAERRSSTSASAK
uniref:Uncharacterized protein n=1 Tax=Aegilops tauschii TaxID=37682 RepID=M8BZ29_AEGTA